MAQVPPPSPITPAGQSYSHPLAGKGYKGKFKNLMPHLAAETACSYTSEDDEPYAAGRSKRKLNTSGEGNMQSAVAEMRVLFANMSSKHEKQFESLHSSIGSIKSEIGDLGRALDFLAQKYDAAQEKIDKLESENHENRKLIQVLENKMESMERRNRSSCIELRNVAKLAETESKSRLCDMLSNLGSSLNISIQDHDIKDVYRVNTPKEINKPIIVEFTSVIKKEAIIDSIRRFNKNKKKEDKLNSLNLKLEGPPMPIFVSESLTQKSKHLFYVARDFAKTNGYRFCWSSNGNIYLRQDENKPLFRVTDESDLNKLKANKN